MSNPLNLKFTYVSDSENPERVLTIARQKLGEGNFLITWAVNNVDEGDNFVKAVGRKLCEERLVAGNGVRLSVPEGQYVIPNALEVVANSSSRPAKKIARDELDWIEEEEYLRDLFDDLNTTEDLDDDFVDDSSPIVWN